jgi:hypothetical protein
MTSGRPLRQRLAPARSAAIRPVPAAHRLDAVAGRVQRTCSTIAVAQHAPGAGLDIDVDAGSARGPAAGSAAARRVDQRVDADDLARMLA